MYNQCPFQLFILDYNNRGEAVNPPMILKTRRSLRAVQFHPHAAPYLLTAEVEICVHCIHTFPSLMVVIKLISRSINRFTTVILKIQQ